MKLIAPALILLMVSVLPQAEEDEANVQRIMDAWVESFNENDPEKISAFYEMDERVEMLVSNGLALRGHKAISNSYARDMKGVRFFDSESRKMKIRVFDQTALVSFVHRFKYEILADGTARQVHIRTTTTLRHTNDGWLIVMEHSSPIHGIERERVIKKW